MEIRSHSSKFFLISIVVLLNFLSCLSNEKLNRLSVASSPYLKQHADNPVDWYEWGDAAIAKAKKENKPILVSVGYASCHWCHVMEEESFMDTAVARIMNENFINIKVDREERPDIDNIYMSACQFVSSEGCGWPLNAFALPDGKPFFAGTYYPKENWMNLLRQVADAYQNQNQKVLMQAEALTNEIRNADLDFIKAGNGSAIADKTIYKNFFDSLYTQVDHTNGGLSGTQKFPMPSVWEFLLQYNYFSKDSNAIAAVTKTLTEMAWGGIYDQIGGGFARYATDRQWRVPHFEKMLYDNGQLMSLYAHAYQVTKNKLFIDIIEGIALFIESELTSEEGGFFSSINAVTEDGEGEFYAWTYNEMKKILGDQQPELTIEYFGVSPKGNWKDKKNILFAAASPAEFSLSKKIPDKEFDELLTKSKGMLLKERNKRIKPSVDYKILTAWNAIMLKGYLDAYTVLGDQKYFISALKNAKFLEASMLRKDGQLWRNYSMGKASVDGFLDDYSLTAKAFIRLYQVTFDMHWLLLSKRVTEYAIKNFYDQEQGLFFYTNISSKDVLLRKMELQDHVIPSSNSVMAEVLFNLSVYFEDDDYLEKATSMVSKLSVKSKRESPFYTQWYYVSGLLANGVNEVAIMGKDAINRNIELQKNYLPGVLFMGSVKSEDLPLLENKMPENRTLIYVCTNRVCKMPVEDLEKALKLVN